MLKKCFSLASAASLAGAVAWVSASTACGGSEDAPVTPADGGSSGTSGTSGGTSGTSGGTSGSNGGGQEAGTGDGGSSGNPIVGKDPATVPGATVTYGKCTAFTKCDGDLKGSWEVSGGCLSDDTFDAYKQFCSGLTVHDVVIKASGTVDFDGTKVKRDSSIFVNAQVDIDKSNCAALQIAGSCSGLAALLKTGQGGSKFDEAACNDSESKCLCTAQATILEKVVDGDTYTTDGNGTLTTNGASQRTYDYCPKGTNVTYKETTAKNPTFGMFVEIKKK